MDIYINVADEEDGLINIVATCGAYTYGLTAPAIDGDGPDLLTQLTEDLIIHDLLEGLTREML
jgi:hypothetical protein